MKELSFAQHEQNGPHDFLQETPMVGNDKGKHACYRTDCNTTASHYTKFFGEWEHTCNDHRK